MLVEKLLKVALLGSSWVMWLLLALSVFSFGAMIERTLYFRKRSDDVDELGERLIGLLEQGDTDGARGLLEKSPSVEASVLAPAMKYIAAGAEAVADSIESGMIRARMDLERGSTLLGTLGNNAPFIGLFGTVIGVIIAFHQLGTSQSSASMNAVMGGIAESLVATGVGLFVAIPAVVAYNLIQKRIGDIESNLQAIAKDVAAVLKSGDYRHASGAPAAMTPASPTTSTAGLRELAAALESN
ncbi:MAG TPA: MotA/TolQ/ExbB proton channel family protein [Polyangiaceae bacterium]|jgi:biopolymer transport protein ExbB/biopolymer transport protein TolQ|nr:MotA/TolQ/ExbB proton channel family protein [Polyangiaceae bacterium]